MRRSESPNRWYEPGAHTHRGSGQKRETSDHPRKLGSSFAGTRRSGGSRDAVAARATGATAPPAGHAHAPANSARLRGPPANWRQRARRCIRSIRSGISPRSSVGPGLQRVAVGGRELKSARRTRFEWPAFNQRISPTTQGRNVNVDPILPPIKGTRVVGEFGLLFRHERVSKFLDIVRGEGVLVEENEWLEKLDQFFHALQIALGFHERSFFQRQRRHGALNRLDDGFLRRRRHPVVTLLRNWNRVKAQAQPRFQSLLRAVMLAMCERS